MTTLARRFRFFLKKRGHRRTGSSTFGYVGELLFFGSFFLLGCGGFAFGVLTLLVPDWRVQYQFVEHTCTVRDTRLAEKVDGQQTLYCPQIKIEYQIQDSTYSSWTYDLHHEYSANQAEQAAILNRFVVGQQVPCWYDPLDPSVAVLVRGQNWWVWLTLIIPASFMMIGGVGFVYRLFHLGGSIERRAVRSQARQAAQSGLFDPGRKLREKYPNVPDHAMITDSPGTTLAYRLPLGTSPAWFLFTLGAACVGWNAIVAGFATSAVNSILDGRPDWWLAATSFPFVLVGIGLLVYFVRQLLLANGIGPTLIEVSHHPFRPGLHYDLFLSQAGRLRFHALQVLLIAEEVATYRQGTDVRKETRCVHQQEVYRRENFEIHRGVPLEVQCDLPIPAQAMHSFRSDHNEVLWKIVVRGKLAGWPAYERSFPVIIYPGQEEPAELHALAKQAQA